ncbi:unnamed protein product [Sphagnum jensenii]|uniref:Secreted protein n=1 Tax=Sphagnum jensenii TaxID=128206 RepID=A0ABP1BVB5_9BRYO
MCHLLCLAVMLYTLSYHLQKFGQTSCAGFHIIHKCSTYWNFVHITSGEFSYVVLVDVHGTRYLNTRAGKDLAYRCIHRDYLPSASCVKKIQATSNRCFQPCYYNFLIWKLENHMTKHVI